MRTFMDPARKAESVRRGLSVFFVIAGLLALYAARSTVWTALALGIPSILLGVGLWRFWGAARLFGMGVCLLLLIGAFVTPLVITVPIGYQQFENPRRVEFLSWAFAGAIGLLGYWGLQYLRSPAARAAYAHSDRLRDAFDRESSSIAGTMALTVFGIWLMPSFMVWGKETEASRRGPARVIAPTTLPDLTVTGLCLRGDSLVQAVIANRGQAGSTKRFSVAYSSLRVGGGGGGTSMARVPTAGTSGLVTLDRAINPLDTATEALDARISIDAPDEVRESDESNNQATFPIVFKYFYPGNLPSCPELPEINGR